MPENPSFNVDQIRTDFPILRQQAHGFPLAYLDNGATTQKPAAVIEAIDDFYRNYNSNVHRGVYAISERATEAFENSRRAVADFLGSHDAAGIVFVRNATEGINLIAQAWARKHLKTGDVVLLTEMEHHANLIPWQLLKKDRGIVLRFAPITPEGRLDIGAYERLLTPEVKLVSVTHMSNVLGTINPIKSLVSKARAIGACTVVDGAQAAPHMPVNIQNLNCDFYVGTGHKMLGPTGVGFVYGKKERWAECNPYQGGGHMINDVTYQESTWNDPPYKFEAGTPDIAAVIGLPPALKYLQQVGLEAIVAYERMLTEYTLKRLGAIEGMTLYGPTEADERGAIVSFNLKGAHPHDVATICDTKNVAIRSGHHCAQPLVRKLGVVATVRASLYLYNTIEEIDRLADALEEAKRILT